MYIRHRKIVHPGSELKRKYISKDRAEETKIRNGADSSCSRDGDSMDNYETEQSVKRPGGFGGYILPSTSSGGPQVHRCSLGTLSITDGICFPHPHQDTFSAGTRSAICFKDVMNRLDLLHLGQSARMHMFGYDSKRFKLARERKRMTGMSGRCGRTVA